MKSITKYWMSAVVIAIFSILQVQAQEEVKKITIKIKKDINGKVTNVEKTYNSLEEMKNDPDLKDVDLELFKGNSFYFSNGDGSNEKVKIKIQKTLDEDVDVSGNQFSFEIDDENFEWDATSHEIKVIKGDDGEVKILRNGEVVEADDNIVVHRFDSGEEDDVKDIKIENRDGQKVIIINGDKEINLGNSDQMKEKLEVLVDAIDDGDHSKMSKIQIVTVRKVKIHIEDFAKKDESLARLNLEKKKELKLQELSYFPNPTDGKFSLRFQGKSVPTEVRITDLTGKVVYSDMMQGFDGQYDKEIDLNDQSKGVYIMQVIQGNKALNKKVVIE